MRLTRQLVPHHPTVQGVPDAAQPDQTAAKDRVEQATPFDPEKERLWR